MHTPKNSRISTRSAGTILVAEDFAPARRLLRNAPRQPGLPCPPPPTAVVRLLAMAAADPPDVVIHGLEDAWRRRHRVCAGHSKTSTAPGLIPVVIMTGSSEAGDRMRAIDAGAADFLTKPVEATELEVRVRSLVRLKHFTDDMDSAETVLRSLALTVEARRCLYARTLRAV